ncbi:MAG: hypothetical protein K2X93_27425 [Candidatus Obscuribacterales bacterium]|nr:hypothetical protein [Candidatus Obscuribacterales bacterium]
MEHPQHTRVRNDSDQPIQSSQGEPNSENQAAETGIEIAQVAGAAATIQSDLPKIGTPALDPDAEKTAPRKNSLKEKIIHEVIQVGTVVIYLAVAFAIIETFRCATLLARCSENDFLAGYATAGIGALLLGKFVFVLEKTKLSNRFKHYPLIVPVLYKSVLFTILVNIILHFEGRFLHHVDGSVPISDATKYWLCFFAHQLAFFVTFLIFFCFRDLSRVLGEGKLYRMFFVSQE